MAKTKPTAQKTAKKAQTGRRYPRPMKSNPTEFEQQRLNSEAARREAIKGKP